MKAGPGRPGEGAADWGNGAAPLPGSILPTLGGQPHGLLSCSNFGKFLLLFLGNIIVIYISCTVSFFSQCFYSNRQTVD